MRKFIKISVFVIILGSLAAGAYFVGARKYAGDYNKIIKLFDEAFVFAKKGGGDMALRKTNLAALESQKFLESPLTKLMKDKDSRALLKARFNLLLSKSYYEMGQYNDDDSLTAQALQIAENYGIAHPSALLEWEIFQKEFIHKINQYSAHYTYTKAADYLQKFISIVEKKANIQVTLKKSFPYLHSVLGKIYIDQRKWADAKAEYEKALSLAEGIPGPGPGPGPGIEEEFYALSYWRLGIVQLKQKQYDDSEKMMKLALERMTNSRRPNNAVLSEIYHNFAEIYKAEGKTDLAGQFFNKSLEWHEKAFGAESPKLLHVLIDYATHLKSIGSADQAKLLEDRARSIEKEASRAVASPESQKD
ncbi:MAG: tetratricopeptide repeat protein [Deltaproteobacteria bacterium]